MTLNDAMLVHGAIKIGVRLNSNMECSKENSHEEGIFKLCYDVKVK